MPNHPLAEVFGYPTDNFSAEAGHCRQGRLCPFKDKMEDGRLRRCNKVSADDPTGVCSVFNTSGERVITCPVRFQQGWLIAQDAAAFFFPPGTNPRHVTEVTLPAAGSKSAGNIDLVLLSANPEGVITDYGALEVQSVYISGNIRRAFDHYMEDPSGRHDMDWRGQPNYPRPDYLSSSRKRLAPQLISKGGILNSWGRKMAVALDTNFFNTLPALEEVDRAEAEIAWLVYTLAHDPVQNRNALTLHRTVYTRFESALLTITQSKAGDEATFIKTLTTLNKKAKESAPHEDVNPNE